MKWLRSTFAGVIITVIVGSGAAMAGPPKTSGIEGVIVVSPIRPGPIRKGEERRSAPAANVEFVVKRGDERVAFFKTDAEGHFHVTLAPGHYVVMREDPGAGIGHWRFEADVVAGQVTNVTWGADSGMR